MRASTTLLLRTLIAVTLAATCMQAHADSDDSYVSAMRYVSLDAQGDNNDSRQYSGTGSFTLGKYFWLQGSVGKLKDDSNSDLGDLTNFGVGAGVKGEHLQFTANFSHYKNDADYTQKDVAVALDWIEKRFSFGLDGFHRSSDDVTAQSVTDTYPLLGTTTIAARAEQELTGKGFGAHASVNITEALSVSVGGMGYSYSNDVHVTTEVAAAQAPAIAQILQRRITARLQDRLNSLSSGGVTRNVTPLDSTYNVGVSYLFGVASVSAQYVRDKILDSDSITNSYILGASIFAGDHWTLSPIIGESKSDSGNITFGGLSVSYNW